MVRGNGDHYKYDWLRSPRPAENLGASSENPWVFDESHTKAKMTS